MVELKLIKDLKIAKNIWEKLSPNESIYDLWDFRYCFYKHNPKPLYFYTFYEDDEPVALLPLTYDPKKNYLEFLAESFIEGNRPFFKSGYEYLLPDFFALDFPRPVRIYDLEPISDFIERMPLEDYVYFLDLTGINNFNDYLLKAFPKKTRLHKFKRVFSLIEKNHQVEYVYDNFSSLKDLIDLSILNFKNDSYLKTKAEQKPFFDLIKLPLDFKMVSVLVNGQALAHSLAVIYKSVYYYMIAAATTTEVKEVFKYLTKANIELAIKAKAKIFDCSLGDCNWKKYWHLSTKPQYKFEKDI